MPNPTKQITSAMRKVSSLDARSEISTDAAGSAATKKEKGTPVAVVSKDKGENKNNNDAKEPKKEDKKWGMDAVVGAPKQRCVQAYDATAGVATKTADIVTLGRARKIPGNETHKIDVDRQTKVVDDGCANNQSELNIEKNEKDEEQRDETDNGKDEEHRDETDNGKDKKSLPELSALEKVLSGGKVLILGPLASILFRDTSILAEQFIVLSIISYRNREFILTQGSLPFTAVIPFTIFSFSLGFWLCHKYHQKYDDEAEIEILIEPKPTTMKLIDECDLTEEEKPVRQKPKSSADDNFFMIAAVKQLPILSGSLSTKKQKRKKSKKKSNTIESKGFFTILSKQGTNKDNSACGWDLMNSLLQNPNYRRKKAALGDGITPISSISDVSLASAVSQKEDCAVGKINMNNTETASFGTEVVDPLFKLLGMDVFITDCPERHIWKQPLLNKCGLRSRPTFVLNILVPWANLTFYFEMPEWIKKWDDIKEEKDDPDDIKALKRFFIKDDEYRNLRFKGIPALVEAPLAIRMLKPAQEETYIDSQYTPVSWHFEDECLDKDGNKQCAILEADIDLNVSGAVRRIVGLVKKHVKKIVIDLAIVLSKPEEKDPDEPSACIGLWRLHKIDLEAGAVIPEKTEEESVQEVLELRETLATNQPIAVAAGSI